MQLLKLNAPDGSHSNLSLRAVWRETKKVCARNVLTGTLQCVTKGAVNAQVTLMLETGDTLVSIITNVSVDLPVLEAGKPASAIVKASEVIVEKR